MTYECLGPTAHNCVLYTGPDIPFLNVKQGAYYDVLMASLLDALNELITNNYVDLKCLYDGCGPETVKLPIAVQKIIDFICQLNTDDVRNKASLFCLSNSSMSSVDIKNKNIKYSTVGSSQGIVFNYNVAEVIENLPAGYSKGNLKVTARGTMANGTNQIASLSQTSGGITIPLNRMPATVDFELRIAGKEGDVVLTRSVGVTNLVSQDLQIVEFYAQGGNSGCGHIVNQTQVNELIAAEVCNLKNAVSALRNLNINSCDKIIIPNNDLNVVINIIISNICTILDALDSIVENTIVSYRECDDNCKERLIEGSIQQVFNYMNDELCKSKARIGQLEAAVELLQEQMVQCCGTSVGGGISGTPTGGTAPGPSIPGSCIGGNC